MAATYDDVDSIKRELEELKRKCQLLEQEKQTFEEKRTKFKELYHGKEKQIAEQSATIEGLKNKLKDNEDTISAMQVEVEDIKMIASVSENTKQEAVEQLNKRHQDEIESLRKAMEDSNEESQKEMLRQFDRQRQQWEQKLNRVTSKNQNLEIELEDEKKRVRSNTGLSEEDELEESMKKAHAEAENLKAVVLPLEQEIRKLKEELEMSKRQLNESKKNVLELTQKCRDLQDTCTQPQADNTIECGAPAMDGSSAVSDENEKLQAALKNVRTQLEVEKAEHSVLKQTWLAANDQFLESQRLLMRDNSIVEGVLTEDQTRQVKILKLKAQASEARENSSTARSPTSSLALLKKKTDKFKEAVAESISSKADTESDTQSFGSFQDFQELQEIDQTKMPYEQASVEPLSTDKGTEVSTLQKVESLDYSKIVPGPKQKLVDESEWKEMLEELAHLRGKVPKSIDQKPVTERYTDLFDDDAKTAKELETMKKRIKYLEDERQKGLEKVSSLEESIQCSAEDAQRQMNELVGKLQDFEKLVASVKEKNIRTKADDISKLLELTKEKEKMRGDLSTLKNERDKLRALQEKHYHELAKESASVPKTIEGALNTFKMYREALSISRAEREQSETKLQNEIAFLKERLKAEQSVKDQLESSLASELHDARGEIISLQALKSVKEDLSKSEQRNAELEKSLEKNKTSVEAMRTKSNEIIKGLREKVLAEIKAKEAVETKLSETKNRLHSMQSALETSETVQRDFVRLSQSLQVQLEQVREELEQEKGSMESGSVRSLDISGPGLSVGQGREQDGDPASPSKSPDPGDGAVEPKAR